MKHLHHYYILVLTCLIAVLAPTLNAASERDVVIYGGTSSGVIAAVRVAKAGHSVVLIEPSQHLGGLSSGGLGATDIGNKAAIGGMSRDFYHRVWRHYQEDKAWTHENRESFEGRGHDVGESTAWTFEPKVAEAIFETLVREAGVEVIRNERLKPRSGVIQTDNRITAIHMESGQVFRGKMFIDASYEGDLMAMAGVSYTVGREGSSRYDETLNGVQTKQAIHHQFIRDIDPYQVPGDPTSGLLPGIHSEGPGDEFSEDLRVQAYCYRLCTTDVPENRVPWSRPAAYDEKDYELLLRNFEAGDGRIPWSLILMPNRKTDCNNNFAVSTDYIGMNYEYPDGDYATRERIIQEHLAYQQGLMWTLANHERVPEEIRKHFQTWGLAKDEFIDTDHWPHQLYIREARRMVSEYVMTQRNCLREEVVEDSVGMGAYNMDSHHVQRYVTAEGFVRNEGDVQVGSYPYPISYRSIIPRKEECENLFAPTCLSSSHIAFGSIRMEPVFMVLGHSSAVAALQAIDEGKAVQDINYPRLKETLLAEGQVLDLDIAVPPPVVHPSQFEGIVVDDTEAVATGFGVTSTSVRPYVFQGYRHDGDAGKGEQTVEFTLPIEAAGPYEVRYAFTAHSNRASQIPIQIRHAKGETSLQLDQQKQPSIDGLWESLGTFEFDPSQEAKLIVSNKGTVGFVVVDAVQAIPVEKP